jgi:zinc transporter ZupT
MAVAIPMFLATKDRWKTIRLTLINGLFEPLTVLFCLLIFGTQASVSENSDRIVSRMLAAVAGVMFCISIQELYPSAIQYSGQRAIQFLSAGMAIGWIISEISH